MPRPVEAAGQPRPSILGMERLHLRQRLVHGGDDQVFEHAHVVRVDDVRVDASATCTLVARR